MNSESHDPFPNAPTLEQWRSQRTLLHCLAISVLILTGTFFIYLYRQVVAIRKSTAEMARYVVQYEKSDTAEVIDRVRQNLNAYRKQNPEFNSIYIKYFGSNEPAPLTPALSFTNAPGTSNTPPSAGQ